MTGLSPYQTWFLSKHLTFIYEVNHAHVRASDVIAVDETPEAGEILERIGQLYAIEAEAKWASPEERLATLARELNSPES